MIVLVTMHQCFVTFVHVHAIFHVCCFLYFFLSVYVYYVFFVWAASYEGLMPPLAACHCIHMYYLRHVLGK